MGGAHFVTLTRPTVPLDQLRTEHAAKCRAFDNAWKRVVRKHPEAKAIRTTEVTRSKVRGEVVHHHFHLIVNTYAVAVDLRSAWIDLNTVAPEAQHVRPADSKALLELVKYCCKGMADIKMPPSFLDSVLIQLKGLKLVSTHGFSPSDTYDENAAFERITTTHKATKRIGEAVFWTYSPDFGDYVDFSTGELFNGVPVASGFA